MYKNPFTPGYEVLSKSGYGIDSNGSLGSAASYLVTNDVPDYAAMFYSATEHEVMTSIKYGNFDQGYDNLREIQESLNGPPIEFYIPHSVSVAEGVGRTDEAQIVFNNVKEKLMDRVNKEAFNEIVKAQREVSGRKIRKIEIEDVLLLRRIKKTIVFENKEEDI